MVQRYLTSINATYAAYTVAMVADDTPDPIALTWIGRSAGKSYPYSYVVGTNGKILWEGPTPTDDSTFLATVTQNGQPAILPAGCPDGSCKCNASNATNPTKTKGRKTR